MKKSSIYLVLVALVLFTFCKRDFSKPNWEVGLMAPVFKTSLSLADLIPDSVSEVNNDSLISLVYQKEIYQLGMDSFLNMPDTGFKYNAYLDSIKLGTINFEEEITLGEILAESGVNLPDSSYFLIPAFTGISSDSIVIDASEYFQTMSLSEGYLDITITNDLPIDIENLIFQLTNSDDASVVLIDTFDIIASGSFVTKTFSLAGKTIKGNLIADIINLDSDGTNGSFVNIYHADAIVTTFRIYGLRPFAATAVFPTQNLINKGDNIIFEINEISLSDVVVRQGSLTIRAFNTIEDPVHFFYTLPGLNFNGDTFSVSGTIEAAQNGVASVLDVSHDITGYNLNLNGAGPTERLLNRDLNDNGIIDPDTINTIFVRALAGIDSTGNLISLSLQDSFIFESKLEGLISEYGVGFMGRDTFPVNGTSDFEFFEQLGDASFQLDQTKLSFEVSNQLGLKGGIRINEIKSANTYTSESKTLDISLIENPFFVERPIDPLDLNADVIPEISVMEISHLNSNANQLLEIIPNEISYDFEVYFNPGITPPAIGAGTDFLYNKSRLKANLNMEVPLSLIASNLALSDTAEFTINADELEDVSSGTLNLIANNGMPLQAVVSLWLLDESNQLIQKLEINNNTISAGIVDTDADRVLVPSKTVLKIPVNQSIIDNLSIASNIKVEAIFDSQPDSEYVKIYGNYAVDFTMTVDFKYHVN